MDCSPHCNDAAEKLVLSGEQMLDLAAARKACIPITRAVRIAALSGWTTAVFAIFTLIAGFSHPSAMWMGLVMCFTAQIELRGGKRLGRLEHSAARALGYNQLVLGTLVLLYSAWHMNAILMQGPPELIYPSHAVLIGPIDMASHPELIHQIQLCSYALMGIIALFTQGGAAWFYFSRALWLENYVRHAPSWIVQIQRAGVAL